MMFIRFAKHSGQGAIKNRIPQSSDLNGMILTLYFAHRQIGYGLGF